MQITWVKIHIYHRRLPHPKDYDISQEYIEETYSQEYIKET
jgi:hypothetical protein